MQVPSSQGANNSYSQLCTESIRPTFAPGKSQYTCLSMLSHVYCNFLGRFVQLSWLRLFNLTKAYCYLGERKLVRVLVLTWQWLSKRSIRYSSNLRKNGRTDAPSVEIAIYRESLMGLQQMYTCQFFGVKFNCLRGVCRNCNPGVSFPNSYISWFSSVS